MAKREDLPFDELMDRLQNEALAAAENLGFLKAMFGNKDVSRKIDGSITGNVLMNAQTCAKQVLIMYLTRAWDDKPGLASLPRATRLLPSADELQTRHISSYTGPLSEYDKAECLTDM